MTKKKFKFKILPWNAGPSAFYESLLKVLSILGIQKQDNFAIYDLFVLLVIFLHRTILKRLGLWRDYLADDELLLASNDEEKKVQKKELSKINQDIYDEQPAIEQAEDVVENNEEEQTESTPNDGKF